MLGLWTQVLAADVVRIATYNPDLVRAGPGLLLQSIDRRNDDQIDAVVAILVHLDADIVLLTGVDYDYGQSALRELAANLGERGLDYPYLLPLRPNTGVPTGLDLDGNGRLGEARDAQGFGRFAGSAGMAILSRYPIGVPRDFSGLLWRDLPGADLPPDMIPAVKDVQLLSTSGHYEVPVTIGDASLRLLVWYATPPVFDGEEDRNGRRNKDETALWLRLLEGGLPWAPPVAPFVVLGQSSLDPADGDGLHAGVRALLTHPALQDPQPKGSSARNDPGHYGDAAHDTAFYDKGVGGLRVDLLLPSADLTVQDAAVLWPPDTDPLAITLATASRHRPVWADIVLP